MRFEGVMIFCESVPKLTSFYTNVMGLHLDPEQEISRKRFARLLSDDGTAVLCLHSGTNPNGGRAKLMFQTDVIEPLTQRLKAFTGKARKPRNIEPGIMTYDFHDPEGNRVQVYGAWR